MEYKITITEPQLMVILNALSERPLKEVIDTFSTIQKQAMDQAPEGEKP